MSKLPRVPLPKDLDTSGLPADRRNDPFARTRLPEEFDRAHRAKLFKVVAEALLEGRMPPPEAALFVGGAVTGWFAGGGDLVRDYLQIAAPRGSHRTVQSLLSLIEDEDDE